MRRLLYRLGLWLVDRCRTRTRIADGAMTPERLAAGTVTPERIASNSFVGRVTVDAAWLAENGWAVDADGNAEFNDVTVRGEVERGD